MAELFHQDNEDWLSEAPLTNKENLSEKFAISLRENGLHSLWRGIESYETFDETQDKLALKEAIMLLHHGLELFGYILFRETTQNSYL